MAMEPQSEYVIQHRLRQVEKLHAAFMDSQTKCNAILRSLGWSKEKLKADTPDKATCRMDSAHIVPVKSLEKHEQLCAVHHCGGNTEDAKYAATYSPALFYRGLQHVVSVYTDSEELSAICSSAEASAAGRLPTQQPSNSQLTGHQFSTLQDPQVWPTPTPQVSPMETLKLVFEWTLIPRQFWKIDMTSLDSTVVQTWIKSNLPKSPLMSTVYDADAQLLQIISTVLDVSCTPDMLLDQLKPLLGLASRDFILRLWQTLAALNMSASLGLTSHHVLLAESATRQQPVYKLSGSSELRAKVEPLMDVPGDLIPAVLTSSQRLALYEHSVQKARQVVQQAEFTAEDLLTTIEKHPGAKVYDEEDRQKAKSLVQRLAKERDYKRRRQSYRAKNVHITKRSPAEIMRDIIAVGMKEILHEAADGDEHDGGVDVGKERSTRSSPIPELGREQQDSLSRRVGHPRDGDDRDQRPSRDGDARDQRPSRDGGGRDQRPNRDGGDRDQKFSREERYHPSHSDRHQTVGTRRESHAERVESRRSSHEDKGVHSSHRDSYHQSSRASSRYTADQWQDGRGKRRHDDGDSDDTSQSSSGRKRRYGSRSHRHDDDHVDDDITDAKTDYIESRGNSPSKSRSPSSDKAYKRKKHKKKKKRHRQEYHSDSGADDGGGKDGRGYDHNAEEDNNSKMCNSTMKGGVEADRGSEDEEGEIH